MMTQVRSASPRLPAALLEFERLYARLDLANPVTVVRAIQGFGKTTLIGSWIDRQGSDVIPIWVSMTEDLAQRAQFAPYLLRRMIDAGLVSGTTPHSGALLELDEVLSSLPEGQSVVLIVDNLAYLDDNVMIADLVTLVQRHRHFRLVVATRSPHAMEAVAAGKVPVTLITTEDLQLSVAEVVELARMMDIDLPEAEAIHLRARIGGWFAPMRLALDAKKSGLAPEPAAMDYLQNLAVRTDRERAILESLRRFSLAERLDVDLVRDFADQDSPGTSDAVKLLERPGLLDRREVGGRAQLVFPTLLQQLLRQRMARDPAATRAFHRRLARWYASQPGDDYPTPAFRHAIAGEDVELAHTIWAEHILMMNMTHPELVAEALAGLTEDNLRRYPGMALSRAVSRAVAAGTDLDTRSATLRTLVESAAQLTAQGLHGLPHPDLLYIATGHMVGLRRAGKLAEALTLAAHVTEQASVLQQIDTPSFGLVSWFQIQHGLTLTLAGRHDEAKALYHRAWEIGLRASKSHVPANAAANLAMTFALQGDMSRAQVWRQRFSDHNGLGYWTSHLAGAGAHVAAGIAALDDLDEAAARREIALLGDGTDELELWPFVAYLSAQFGLLFGNPRDALSAVNRAVNSHPVQPTGEGSELIARARADLLIAAGNGQFARLIVNASGASNTLLGVTSARLARLAGDPARARGIAARLFNANVLSPRDHLELLITDGLAAAQMGDTFDAGKRLANAHQLVKDSGIRSALRLVTDSDRHLLAAVDPGLLPAVGRPIYPDAVALVDLTRREQQLLTALTGTGSRSDLAQAMHLSVNTVKTQLATLYRKLGATSRDDAIMRAHQLGLLK